MSELIDDLTTIVAMTRLSERERCARLVREFPQHIALTEEETSRYGLFVRQVTRDDLAEAILEQPK